MKIKLFLWRRLCPERLLTASVWNIHKAGRPSRCIVTSSVLHWLHLCQTQTQVETAPLCRPIPLFILCLLMSLFPVSVCFWEHCKSNSQCMYTCQADKSYLILSHWFCLRPSQTQVETVYCPDDSIIHIYFGLLELKEAPLSCGLREDFSRTLNSNGHAHPFPWRC